MGKHHGIHDIPAEFDPARDPCTRLPGSIKALTARSGTIGLADALRFHDVMATTGVRLIVGRHRQVAGRKRFVSVTEIDLRAKHARDLWGEITREDIIELRDSIHKTRIPLGLDGKREARRIAKAGVKALAAKRGAVTLNPKIGSTGEERRIQCSVTLGRLARVLESDGSAVRAYKTRYFGILLPFDLESSQRENATSTAARPGSAS